MTDPLPRPRPRPCPRPRPRPHQQIIADAGGPAALAQALAPRLDTPLRRLRERAKAWKRAGRIPGGYWAVLAELRVAPLSELAGARGRSHGAAR